MKCVTSSGYLRYPHIHGDLLVFVSEDDVWLAPADGGRAWRLSADKRPGELSALLPRRRQDRLDQLAGRQPEVYTADPDGSDAGRAHLLGRRQGLGSPAGPSTVRSSRSPPPDSPNTYLTWAYAVPLEGEPPRRLPFGPVTDLAWRRRARPCSPAG